MSTTWKIAITVGILVFLLLIAGLITYYVIWVNPVPGLN